MQELLDSEAACKALGVSRRTLERHVAAGHLAAVRIGTCVRFTPSDLDRFTQTRRGRVPVDLEEYLRGVVEAAPALTSEQRARLATLLQSAA